MVERVAGVAGRGAGDPDAPDPGRGRPAGCGDRVDPAVEYWTVAHADLHWADLLEPSCVLVDWEGWGQAPAGYDVATLYVHSVLQPAVAKRVTGTGPRMHQSVTAISPRTHHGPAAAREKTQSGPGQDLEQPTYKSGLVADLRET